MCGSACVCVFVKCVDVSVCKWVGSLVCVCMFVSRVRLFVLVLISLVSLAQCMTSSLCQCVCAWVCQCMCVYPLVCV